MAPLRPDPPLYAAVAMDYLASGVGFPLPLPLPPQAKQYPPKGVTGRQGVDPTPGLGGPAAVAADVLVTAKSPFPDGLGSKCLADRPASAPQGGEVGEGEDSTGRGPASAPECAGLPSCGRWRNGALPEPPWGLSVDGLAVWGVVLAHPGATQREVFGHLVPTMGRRRVKEALLEGVEQGWLDLRQDKAGGRYRHYLSGTVVTHEGAVEAAFAVLEHALADGQLLDRQQVLRLTAVLRRVVPISSGQVHG